MRSSLGYRQGQKPARNVRHLPTLYCLDMYSASHRKNAERAAECCVCVVEQLEFACCRYRAEQWEVTNTGAASETLAKNTWSSYKPRKRSSKPPTCSTIRRRISTLLGTGEMSGRRKKRLSSAGAST